MAENYRMREFREKAGLTQQQVAAAMGVTNGVVSHWESGRKLPNAAKLPRIAALYKCSINDLFEADVLLEPVDGVDR